METKWYQADLERYILDEVEENSALDYKAAGSLSKADDKKSEITKDISAMANSGGGIIIYGIREYQTSDKRHLPEKLDGIDRTVFSKEWLDQVISTIKPRIGTVRIYPVDLDSEPNHIAFVVEIPQSTTAHQARDLRYYKRLNSTSTAMEDYEIRDVMNRATMPNAEVTFGFKVLREESIIHNYRLTVFVKNQGVQVINDFKLKFVFPSYIDSKIIHDSGRYMSFESVNSDDLAVTFLSSEKLFPEDEIDVGIQLNLQYYVTTDGHFDLAVTQKRASCLQWTLFADNMTPKQGKKPFAELNRF